MTKAQRHWLNGSAVEHIPVADRGLFYGHSCYETIVIWQQGALLLRQHLMRLKAGCSALMIPLDVDVVAEEIREIAQQYNLAVVRLTITAGESQRGYLLTEDSIPNRIVSLYEYPDESFAWADKGIELGLSSVVLPNDSQLAGIKHGNRLTQVMARNRWQPDWQEAVMLSPQRKVVEGTQSNIFIIEDEDVLTPPLKQSGIVGVVRNFVLEHARECGLNPRIRSFGVAQMENADEVFLTNSVIGLWPVKSFQLRTFDNFLRSACVRKMLIDYGAIPTA